MCARLNHIHIGIFSLFETKTVAKFLVLFNLFAYLNMIMVCVRMWYALLVKHSTIFEWKESVLIIFAWPNMVWNVMPKHYDAYIRIHVPHLCRQTDTLY